ncbi:hypothetical protein FF1_046704 [Malus domestica]
MPKITPTIILDKRGLRGQRFLAWYRHIENVSKVKDILYVLKQSPPHVPPTKLASNEEYQNYDRHYEDNLQAKCLILTSLSEELMKLHKHMDILVPWLKVCIRCMTLGLVMYDSQMFVVY